jgi:hypothetical protein
MVVTLCVMMDFADLSLHRVGFRGHGDALMVGLSRSWSWCREVFGRVIPRMSWN